MKDIFVVIAILAIVFGGNYFVNKYIKKSGKEFLELVSSLEKSIDMEDINLKTENVNNILNVEGSNSFNCFWGTRVVLLVGLLK